eukprot:COSAG01_NODE_23_length_37704_cov_30.005877_44_plen_168_part_00
MPRKVCACRGARPAAAVVRARRRCPRQQAPASRRAAAPRSPLAGSRARGRGAGGLLGGLRQLTSQQQPTTGCWLLSVRRLREPLGLQPTDKEYQQNPVTAEKWHEQMSRTKRFRTSGESRSQSAGIEKGGLRSRVWGSPKLEFLLEFCTEFRRGADEQIPTDPGNSF